MKDNFVDMINGARKTMGVESGSDAWAFQYANCISIARNLSPIINSYCFQDVCMAVFCINSWHKNRSVQECILGLNAALVITKEYGSKTIDTYGDFREFFLSIKRLCKPSEREDYVLPVMGQVMVESEGRWYPAILGCGMVQEYPRLYFGQAFCAVDGKRDEYRSLLRYVARICRELDYGGWTETTQDKIEFVLPSEDHWQRTCQWFKAEPMRTLIPEVVEELSAPILPIEMRHFVRYDEYQLPLFNPSIITDYVLQRISSIGDDKTSALVESVIASEAINIYGAKNDGQIGCIAFPVFRHEGLYFEDCPCTFLMSDSKGMVTLFYSLAHGDGCLQQLIDALRSSNDELEVIDTGWTGRNPVSYGVRTTAIRHVTLVAYVDDVEPVLSHWVPPVSDLADITCGALDLLTILQSASSLEEMSEFFAEVASGKYNLVRGFSGIAPHFLWWRDNNRSMLPGARKHEGMNIWCDFNDTDRYYCEFFRSIEGNYPFAGGFYTLGSPFFYTYKESDRGFVAMSSKADKHNLGVSRGIGNGNKGFIHVFAMPYRSDSTGDYDFDEEGRAYSFYEDLLMCMVNSLEDGFARLANALGGVIQIGYVARGEAGTQQLVCVDGEYGVYGLSVEEKPYMVLFTVDSSLFVPRLVDAVDRSVECRLACDILSLFPEDNEGARSELVHLVQKLASSNKMVDLRDIELPYTWSGMWDIAELSDVSKARAIRAVATSAAKADVTPGAYYGRDANRVLRSFQEELTAEFKRELSVYEHKMILTGLYAALAQAMHSYFVHSMRFGSFERVDEAESQRVNDKTYELREDARHRIRAARYCIETILCYDLRGDEIPDNSDLSALISLADQLVSLCDEADILHFAPPGFGIEVDDDYIVSAIEDDSKATFSKKLRMRQLFDPGHLGEAATEDADYISRAKNAFQRDTNISFNCFLDVLDTLALGLDASVEGATLLSNVVLIGSCDLVTFLVSELGDFYTEHELVSCINFITIDSTALRVIAGKEYGYLPFGRMKDRPNRLELKPIVAVGDKVLFAPVALGMLRRRWVSGIAERFLPVKDSFSSLYSVICQWKRHFEKSLESDTYQLFIDAGYSKASVYKGIELKKKGRHPEYLGDYDVLAFDQDKMTIWAIECKEFEKVESAFDFMQLQERWFGKKGLLSKFERRINYLRNNATQVADDLGFTHAGTLEVRALLVCNKLFDNLLGSSSFEVVTLNELKSIIQP